MSTASIASAAACPAPASLDEAIRRSVAHAIETGELLDVAAEAERLAASCPDLAGACVADLLIRAGGEARINLALGADGRSAAR